MNSPTILRPATSSLRAPKLASLAEALAAARALVPAIRNRAAATEDNRIVSRETIAELHESGLFGVVTPRLFGGSELGFEALVAVTVEIAQACGSTGWVYGVLAGHSWLVNLFPPAAQYALFEDPEVLIATVFRLGGEAEKVAGGYRIRNAEGRFCSGIDHAKWVVVGNPVRLADGNLEQRFHIVSRDAIEVVDDWHTTGMRGTGSRSIRVADAFIPDDFSALASEMSDGTAPGTAIHPGALYRTPFRPTAPFSIVGAPIGMALSAARMVAEQTGTLKASAGDEAQQGAFLGRFAEAVTEIQAGLALVLEDARRLDNQEASGPLTPLEMTRFGRDWSYAVQKARYAATRLFEVGGGSSIYDGSELQRAWRDVNAAAQHFAFGWDSAMIGYGRAFVKEAKAAG